MVRLSRGRGSEAWQMMQPTWTDISQMSICLLPQVDKWHRQRLPSSQKHIRRPMVLAVIVGGRVVVRCSREDDGQQGSRPREEVACAGVLSHPSPGSTEHRHRLPSHRSWTSKEARENKSLGQPAKRPITRRCRARPHFQVSTGGGLSFAGPQFPPSRHRPSPVATQDEGAALVELSLTPIKNQPPRHPRHPSPPSAPERTKPSRTDPLDDVSPFARLAFCAVNESVLLVSCSLAVLV